MSYLKLQGAPFDDALATYDHDLHKYTPLYNYVIKRLGTEFFEGKKQSYIESLINDSRDNVYLFIESESNRNYDVIEYQIAKKDYRGNYSYREQLIEAIVQQVKYAHISGGDMTGDMHGFDFKKGTYIQNFDKLRSNFLVSDNVKRKLTQGNDPILTKKQLHYSVDPDDYRSDY